MSINGTSEKLRPIRYGLGADNYRLWRNNDNFDYGKRGKLFQLFPRRRKSMKLTYYYTIPELFRRKQSANEQLKRNVFVRGMRRIRIRERMGLLSSLNKHYKRELPTNSHFFPATHFSLDQGIVVFICIQIIARFMLKSTRNLFLLNNLIFKRQPFHSKRVRRKVSSYN